ncbi:MAG: IS6 family transposase [Gammaproteobacteria bacterium]|nr:IS6 family transposase [Gammaproteobacteria bacterium]
MRSKQPEAFKWRHFTPEIILLCVRWYLRYRLSYRDLVEMMEERGLSVAHSTIIRWVHHFSLELEKRVRPFLKTPNDSWRMDETYIKIKKKWMYLYRAVDSRGQTVDFYLSRTRNQVSAKRFLSKLLNAKHTQTPRVMTTDKHSSYGAAINDLKKNDKIPKDMPHRQIKYLNNIIEQDHRRIKWKTKTSMGYDSFKTAYKTIKGLEIMHMLRKHQLFHLFDRTIQSHINFISRQFGVITAF